MTRVWGGNRVGVRFSPVSNYNDMRDSDPVSHFAHAAQALAPLGLAYLHVVAGNALQADSLDRAVVDAMRNSFRGTFILNDGYDYDRGNAVIASGLADFVSFGELFLANPDLPERFAERAALNTPDQATFYGGDARGYTDYPIRGAATGTTGEPGPGSPE